MLGKLDQLLLELGCSQTPQYMVSYHMDMQNLAAPLLATNIMPQAPAECNSYTQEVTICLQQEKDQNCPHYHVYVRPHFGTVPVPEPVVQFRNWNTHIPKSALAIFLCWCPFGDHTDSKYGNRCSIFLNVHSELGYQRHYAPFTMFASRTFVSLRISVTGCLTHWMCFSPSPERMNDQSGLPNSFHRSHVEQLLLCLPTQLNALGC